MSHRLRMSAEIGDWLADLCSSAPGSPESLAATEVGAALAAVLAAADPLSVPLARVPGAEPAPDLADPREVADHAYQRLLEELQQLRRETADVATDRKNAEDHLREQQDSGADSGALAELRRELAAARQREDELSQRNSRVQRDVDAFRAAKETAKAMYTAAEASRRVSAAFDAVSALEGGTADSATDDAAAASPDEDNLAELTQALTAAGERLTALAAQAAQTLRKAHPRDRSSGPEQSGSAHQPSGAEPPPGLLELHADPLAADIRLLFAIEPAGTVTLLAVLEGEAAISQHRYTAIGLAGELLEEIRGNGWPAEAGELTFADAAAFLAQYFPDRGDEIMRRSAEIANASGLRELRRQRGLSLAELAQATGMSERELSKLEAGDLGLASVREADTYLRALGGRLRVTAELDGEQQVLI